MEGKTITKSIKLDSGFMLIKLDDGEIHLIHMITPEGIKEDLLELMEEEPEKVSTKTEEKEETADSGGDAYTWKDLLELDYKELKTLCKENNLDTDPKDYDKDEVDDFRKEVAKEIEVEIPTKGGEEKKDDKYTWDELKEMDYDELEDLIDEEDLDIDPNDYDEDTEESKFRKAIAKELGIATKPNKK